MGMFDYVRCEMPLPDGWKPDGDGLLQTKDFGCALATHVITSGGRLMLGPGIDDEPGMKDSGFHGWMRFYGHEGNINSPNWSHEKHWHEYRAKFTDGQLVEIVKVENER